VKAALLSEVDGPLEVVEVPDPVAGEGQALVRVRAAGINFADVMIRRGVYPQMRSWSLSILLPSCRFPRRRASPRARRSC
jgi:NADPH:quinone reductase-like Zn-dependent oxidoreductase